MTTTKKLIQYGDTTSPRFVRQRNATMDGLFDGFVIGRTNTLYGPKEEYFATMAWGKEKRFEVSDFTSDLDDLSDASVRKYETFLYFNVRCRFLSDDATEPGDPSYKVGWANSDDDEFTNYVVHNAKTVATVARQGGCRGVFFDCEAEGANKDYWKLPDGVDWFSCSNKARRRGREVMRAFREGFPGVSVFLALGQSIVFPSLDFNLSVEQPWRTAGYGLLVPFLNGLTDELVTGNKLIDGYEESYGFVLAKQFVAARKQVREAVPSQLMLGDSGTIQKYKDGISCGFAIWLNYYPELLGWDITNPDKNYFSPIRFESSVRTALDYADDYVWIYSQRPASWWRPDGDLSDGYKRLPQEYAAALRRARG